MTARSLENRAGLAAGKTFEEIGGVELCERAFHLLIAAPLRAWCVYLLGLCPFGLVLLYFLTDMTASPFAEDRLGPFSFAVAVAVLWWRAWQARFAAELFAVLSRRPYRLVLRWIGFFWVCVKLPCLRCFWRLRRLRLCWSFRWAGRWVLGKALR